jgi:acetolactate synthase-1/2/3 large subunit
MEFPLITRRLALQAMAASTLPAFLPARSEARITHRGWVAGSFSGARALVETLIAEGTTTVFGIPGAQENELWDEFKQKGLDYTLVTHEFSAACMADGFARATGRPGVLAIVPGPGITNSMTGLGEARLDSIPIVCIVGDVARGKKYRPFQVHALENSAILKTVCKEVIDVESVGDIPYSVRLAFQLAQSGEPGPVAVVVPYDQFIERHLFRSAPLAPPTVTFDQSAAETALSLLSRGNCRVGIYAGLGCMDESGPLTRLAEILNAPVATSVSGKGAIAADHPLSVGWGYGPQGSVTAERIFAAVDIVLAIGVRFSEVSTGFYSFPYKRMIHVDACAANLGAVYKPEVAVHAEAGVFLDYLLKNEDKIARPKANGLEQRIEWMRGQEEVCFRREYCRGGIDPMDVILAMREATDPDAMVYVDVTASEHWAAEAWKAPAPRTYFNPTDNQAMGWSIPAAIGGQVAFPERQVCTITGDGCFLMTAMEITTAARERLPVKFFILDDGAYHYMQALQKAAYKRTTATILAGLNYEALAEGFGVEYLKIENEGELESGIRQALKTPGPVLVQVCVEYGKRPLRWLDAAKKRYMNEMTLEQKLRFGTRLGARSVALRNRND